MKTIFSLTILTAITVFISNRQPVSGPPVALQKGFAVVELFTSEGCSSCPPADQVVNKIAAKINSEQVYILNFHVDYWNYLGWKDPYSAVEFTKRQYWYASKLGNDQIYTPQMIINGQKAFVGSNEKQANEAIEQACKATAINSIALASINKDVTSWQIKYTLGRTAPRADLYFALIEKNLSSIITAGENRGKKLYHSSVVRYMSQVKANIQEGNVTINYDRTINGQYSIIAWLQLADTKEIIAANQLTP
jgi:hypothetical protein